MDPMAMKVPLSSDLSYWEKGRKWSLTPRPVEVAWNSESFRTYRTYRSICSFESEEMESAWDFVLQHTSPQSTVRLLQKKKEMIHRYA